MPSAQLRLRMFMAELFSEDTGHPRRSWNLAISAALGQYNCEE